MNNPTPPFQNHFNYKETVVLYNAVLNERGIIQRVWNCRRNRRA
jgi:hypothetical protein